MHILYMYVHLHYVSFQMLIISFLKPPQSHVGVIFTNN